MSRLEQLIAELCPDGVEYKSLDQVCVVETGTQLNKENMLENGLFPVMNGGISHSGYWNEYNVEANTIAISQGGASAGFVNYMSTPFWAGAHCFVVNPVSDKIVYKFLYYFIKHNQNILMTSKHGAGIPGLNKKHIYSLKIPVPPLEVQEEIVRILDNFTERTNELTAVLEAEQQARQKQYGYYRDHLLAFDALGENRPAARKNSPSRLDRLIAQLCPDGVEFVMLNEVLDYEQPTKYIVSSTNYDDDFTTPVLTAGQSFILGYTNEETGIYEGSLEKPVIIFDDFTTSFHWVDFRFKVKSSAMKIITNRDNSISLFRYLYYAMKSINYVIVDHSRQWIEKYSKFQIPLPPLEVQEEIVRILDQFNTLTTDLTSGLPAEIAARQKQYAYYRDKLLTFREAKA